MSLTGKIARKLQHKHLARLSETQLQARLAKRRGAMILCYHALDPALDAYPWRTTAQALDAHLTLLGASCDVLPLTRVIDLLRDGTLPARDRPVAAICFDDGYACTADLATPVLDRHGVEATLFAPRDLITREGRTYLSPTGLRDLAAHPLWRIGAHGITHTVLTGLQLTDAEAELRQSRDWLGDLLGAAPGGFAYPQGQLSPAVRAAAATLYDHAMATDTRAIPGFDSHQILRLCPTQAHDPPEALARALLMSPVEDGLS